jgi:tetratricopeptide (TPR) repeat protein
LLLGAALRQADAMPDSTKSSSRPALFIRRLADGLDRRKIRIALRFATFALIVVALRFSLIMLFANPWVEWIPGVAEQKNKPNEPDPLTLARCVHRSSVDPLDGDAFALIARAHFTDARTTTNSAIAESELERARIAAESGLRGSPAHRELHHLLGGILLRQGDYEAGIRAIDNQVWLTPADPNLMSACGRMLAVQYRNASNSLPSLIMAFRLAVSANPERYASPALNALIAGGVPKRYWDDVFSVTPLARAVYAGALDRLGLSAAAMAMIEKKNGETDVALVSEITDEMIRLDLWILKTRLLIKTGRTGDELAKTLDAAYHLHTDLQLETYFTSLAPSFDSLSARQTLVALTPLKDSNVRHPPKGLMWIIANALNRTGDEAAGYEIIDELHRINPEMRTARALAGWHLKRRQPDVALNVLNATFSAYGASLLDSERLYIYEQRARALLLMKQPEAARSELEQALRVIETNPKLQSSRSRINSMIIESSR